MKRSTTVPERLSGSAENLELNQKLIKHKQSHPIHGQAGGRGTLCLEAGGPDKSGSRGDDVIHLGS